MTTDEIVTVAEIAAGFGISDVKLTGGEPLLRDDLVDIIRGLCAIQGIGEVSMTTCGISLSKRAKALKEAGLSRVNVNLPTLKRETYNRITGEDLLDEVIKGIESAIEAGLQPIKLNMVILSGINDNEVKEMIDFASRRGVILQIIELIPSLDSTEPYENYHRDLSDIEEWLRGEALKITSRRLQARKRYLLKNGAEVEVVKPMHNTEFCLHCTRIRVTADGKLKPCLMQDDNLVDLLPPLRGGATKKELRELFMEAVGQRKPFFGDHPQDA